MTKRASQRRFVLPPDVRQLLVVRHGAAQGQDTHVTPEPGAHNDPPLAEVGLLQAEALGAYLASQDVAAIFTSALQRTVQTAAPLARLTGLTPVAIPEFNEVHLGQWEHGEFERRLSAKDPLCRQVFAEERWDIVPGAESMAMFSDRITRGLSILTAAVAPGTTAVAVLHAAVIAGLCSIVTGSRAFAFLAPDNISISRILVDAGGGMRLRSFNETGHIPDPERRLPAGH